MLLCKPHCENVHKTDRVINAYKNDFDKKDYENYKTELDKKDYENYKTELDKNIKLMYMNLEQLQLIDCNSVLTKNWENRIITITLQKDYKNYKANIDREAYEKYGKNYIIHMDNLNREAYEKYKTNI